MPFQDQPKDLKAKHITPFEIELTWATPSVYLRGSYRYHVFYQMKNSTENSVVTLVEQHTLTDLIPDVVYTIWVTAEKDKFMGDPSDSIECHTPRCGKLQRWFTAFTFLICLKISVEVKNTKKRVKIIVLLLVYLIILYRFSRS